LGSVDNRCILIGCHPEISIVGLASAHIAFEKKLSSLEIREHFIRIPKRYRDKFIPRTQIIVHFGQEEIPMKIDNYGRMNPSFLLWSSFTKKIWFDPLLDTLLFETSDSGVLVSVNRRRAGASGSPRLSSFGENEDP
jgi:hypothetical protein